MLRHLLVKELRETALSPRALVLLALSLVMVLLSVFTGLEEYRARQRYHLVATELSRQAVSNQVSWYSLAYWGEYRVYREPSELGILVAGLENDVGRKTAVAAHDEPMLTDTRNNEQPIFAIFGGMDLLFAFNVVLSLLAVLYTYDAVSGEREQGTLKLLVSSAVPRDQILLSKFLGGLIGIGAPVGLTLGLASLFLWVHPTVHLSASDWLRAGLVYGTGLIYVSFFLALGLLVSAWTRRSSASLLTLLLAWVVIVLIGPRTMAMVSGHGVEVPSSAELQEAREHEERQGYLAMSQWRRQWAAQNPGVTSIPDDIAETKEREIDEGVRRAVARIDEDFERKLNRKQSLTRWLSRTSPSGCLTFSGMTLADTGLQRKQRFLEAARAHRDEFGRWVEGKIRELERNNDGGSGANAQPSRLDIRDMPQFVPARASLGPLVHDAGVELVLLLVYTGLAYGLAHWRLRRYDPR